MGKWDNTPAEIMFGTRTPFYLLSLHYGIFRDPELRRTFTSLNSYLGFAMLQSDDDRKSIMVAPNGYIANLNLMEILENASKSGEQAVVPNWDDNIETVLSKGVWLKYTQNTELKRILLSTNERQIIDNSYPEDIVLCTGKNRNGKNLHGKILEEVRNKLKTEG
jgi:hypothetical protein